MAYLEVNKKRRASRVDKGKESNSITLFGSFLRKEGEGFGGIWRDFNSL